ncbi:helix-turn-helix domain-containing GNAT family N-acetyltransferase [Mesorhizobium sp. BAC0120]|uniref:bifunctional helix-turn-helix transcriptional regulator/GNAT family N-acetyltransferase n=1 Tax=Mesorhizobium sp. BAC0120 TaxID=3090670 RepID=UPI00298C1319|nr:helix-turn-helix domain-containing GNAT family N-acetyltransferase [Mesorhizobium sp. BAC0120]MDW6024476.1 helix-turn-helix domain-containing GNAT family N-acetyltransferase [Mesorhizobium sp. BAC0120]
MDEQQIRQVRSFNRLVTQRIGALEDSYLSRGRPLGEARVIFEIGSSAGIDLRALRQKLGLDSGYLSRLMRSLEVEGLIEVRKSPIDGRVRHVSLTRAGQAEYASYDRLSDELAESILAPLDAARREQLIAAMAEVERLLGADPIELSLEQAASADARWCLGQYFAELDERFENGFDQTLGNNLTEAEMTPPAGYLILARLAGRPVGCGALKRLSADAGEIKRVWVAHQMRGKRVASRLMDELEALARKAGFHTVKLDTNKALTEAHALYRKRGYREIERYNDNPYAHHWFEKRL